MIMKSKFSAILFFCLILLSLPQIAGVSPALAAAGPKAASQAGPELTTENLLRFDPAPDAPRFSTGPEEKAYLLGADVASRIPRQGRFPGIRDALFEQLVFNKRFFMNKTPEEAEKSGDDTYPYPCLDSPGVWLLSVHYP